MKRSTIKIIAYVIGGIAIISVGGIVLLTTMVDPNNYKPQITKSVEDATGRKFSIDGKIKWTFLPSFGLEANKVSLSNPKEFGNTNFAQLNSIKLSIELIPLLHSEVMVRNITINGLSIALIDKGKENNWTFTNSQAKPSNTNNSNSKFKFGIDSLNIENSKLTYLDTKINHIQKLNSISLQIKTGALGKIDFDAEKNQMTLKDVEFSFDHTMRGKINLAADLNATKYNGNVNIPTFSLNSYLDEIGVARPKIPNRQLFDKFALSTVFAGTKNSLLLDKINIHVGPSTVLGQINVTSMDPLITRESITVDKADVADYSDLNGLKLPVTGVALNGTFNISKTSGKINAIENLNVQNLTLLGFNVNSFTSQLDKVTSDKIVDISQATTAFNTIQAQLKHLSAPGRKDLTQKTDLGSLHAEIVVREGILTTPEMTLVGPSMATKGRGVVNLNNKTIDYTTYTQFTHKNPLLSTLVFPYHMEGKLSDFNGSVDMASIQKQVIKYYTDNIPGISKSIKNAAQKTGAFFSNLFK